MEGLPAVPRVVQVRTVVEQKNRLQSPVFRHGVKGGSGDYRFAK